MAQDPRARALEEAYKILARRDAFSAEIRQRLLLRGLPESAVAAAMDRLVQRGMVNDETLGRKLMANRPADRPFGRLRWRFELAKRGLDEATIERIVGEVTEAQELARLTEALRLRYPHAKDRARAVRYAVGQGFEESVVCEAIEQVFGPEPEAL